MSPQVLLLNYYFGSSDGKKSVTAIFSLQVGEVSYVFSRSGLETHSAEIENDLITLCTMLKSRHSDAFRLQLEDWIRSLQELGKAVLREGFKKDFLYDSLTC